MEKLNWTTQRRKVKDLIPYAQNPRQMTEKQAADLRASLEKFDLVEIPAVNTDNTIIAGHMRLRIMKILGRGEEEIDVRVPSRLLSEDELKEYCVRSNRNTGEWDYDLLANFDKDLLVDWGFNQNDFNINVDKYGEDFTLPDGNKVPFQQMTFTLSDNQAEQIKTAIILAKTLEEYKGIVGNDNSNGNALFLIVSQWQAQKI